MFFESGTKYAAIRGDSNHKTLVKKYSLSHDLIYIFLNAGCYTEFVKLTKES